MQKGVVDRLKEGMDLRGRSVNQLASELQMYQSTLSRQINNHALTLETVIGAARVLDLDLLWLLTGETRTPAAEAPGRGMEGAERARLLSMIEMILSSGDGIRRAAELARDTLLHPPASAPPVTQTTPSGMPVTPEMWAEVYAVLDQAQEGQKPREQTPAETPEQKKNHG